MAAQLAEARRGLPNYGKLKCIGVRAMHALAQVSRTPSEKVKTQQFLHDFLVRELYPDTLDVSKSSCLLWSVVR